MDGIYNALGHLSGSKRRGKRVYRVPTSSAGRVEAESRVCLAQYPLPVPATDVLSPKITYL